MKKYEELAAEIAEHTNTKYEAILAMIEKAYPDDLQAQLAEANKKTVKLMSEIDCLVDDNEALSKRIAELEEKDV